MRELILDDISEVFNFCVNQEWNSSEDPSRKNLAHAMCRKILQDFVRQVSISVSLTFEYSDWLTPFVAIFSSKS
jgi:hypothetical protein